MGDEIVIREVRPGDGEALARCWIEFGEDYAALDPLRFRGPRPRGSPSGLSDASKGPHDLWLVADRGGEVVGFVEAQVWPGADDDSYELMRETSEAVLKISSLFVRGSERGRGIGRELATRVEEWGRGVGATSAVVIAIADSPTAVPFYRDGMGYRPNSLGLWKPL